VMSNARPLRHGSVVARMLTASAQRGKKSPRPGAETTPSRCLARRPAVTCSAMPRLLLSLLLGLLGGSAFAQETGFVEGYLREARGRIDEGDLVGARAAVERALERDAKDLRALALLAEVCEQATDTDGLVHAMHRWLDVFDGRTGGDRRDRQAQQQRKQHLDRLLLVDGEAAAWEELQRRYVKDLMAVAGQYRKRKDLLGALEIYQTVLQVAPDQPDARKAIAQLRSTGGREVAVDDVYAGGDPTGGLSEAEIEAMDREHLSWDAAYTDETDNYRYRTNAGYLVLKTSAIAMEQMNRFYRRFFRFQEDGGKTPQIEIRIFRNRDEYLSLGRSPQPWSAGHFIGDAVETYAGGVTGKESVRSMYRTLFHEAAHQFVSMTGPMVPGWLNEAYASFFEGCTILSNGTVKWNQAPPGRLLPLAARMEQGWMSVDEIPRPQPGDPWPQPTRAPTFRIVVSGDYQWGPPWYAPTWGVVYFLYNYRHEDGRTVFREVLHDYYRSFKRGRPQDAIAHFEETVLQAAELSPVQNVDELDPIWKEWILRLRDRETGKASAGDELVRYAEAALARDDRAMALQLYDEARELAPRDPELLWQVAVLLEADKQKPLSAARYREFRRALELLERTSDERYEQAGKKVERLDPLIRRLKKLREQLAQEGLGLARGYEARQLPTMALEIARRMTASYSIPEAMDYYVALAERTGRSLARWRVAYDERSLRGWSDPGAGSFQAYGRRIRAEVARDGERMVTQELVCDVAFDADFSLSAEMQVEAAPDGSFLGELVGLCFGRKGDDQTHAVLLHPKGYLDISSKNGGDWKVHDHRSLPVGSSWHTLRIDVTDADLDVYYDGRYVRSLAFGDPAVVRGGFGLICGPGKATFRNVRLLERDPFDPAARIERQLAMARVLADPSQRTEGSFAGFVPPELGELDWRQGEGVSLGQLRGKPVLLAFWGVAAERVIPCLSYLRHLHERWADSGLQIVVVCDASTSPDALAALLQEQPLEGCRFAVDAQGTTYDRYYVKAGFFGMPRMLLLDNDGVVVFEGDPGLKAGRGWQPGDPKTYLDDALAAQLQAVGGQDPR
jgi:hypothetical protein